MPMIILRILYAFLIDLVNFIISSMNVRSGSDDTVTAFIQILFQLLIKAVMLVPFKYGIGHVLFKSHSFDELTLFLGLVNEGCFVHVLIFLFDIFFIIEIGISTTNFPLCMTYIFNVFMLAFIHLVTLILAVKRVKL